MIDICIIRNRDNQIEKFKVSGHAGYANKGEDIVCAAVSAIVQTAVMGISDVLSIDMEYTQTKGYASFCLPHDISLEQIRSAQIILETMLIGLKSIELQYGSFVSIKELEVN